jgi:hypothetical protein
MAKTEQVKIDGHSFSVSANVGLSEADFIATHIGSVKPSLGSDENKNAFLKEAHKQILATKPVAASK